MNHAIAGEFAHEKISAWHAEADVARLARSARGTRGTPGLLRKTLRLAVVGTFFQR